MSRWVAVLVLAIALAGCGAGETEVEAAQSGPGPSGPVAPDRGDPTTVLTSTAPADPAPSTTIVVAPDGDPGASTVDGLDAATLQEALTARPSERSRTTPGPVAERLTLADGTVVWRVRIPGSFPARDARATVAIDGRDIGLAGSPASGDALIVVTTTPDGLLAGGEVTYRWGGAEPIAAGPLVVVG